MSSLFILLLELVLLFDIVSEFSNEILSKLFPHKYKTFSIKICDIPFKEVNFESIYFS
jgi:hypothetical protein